MVQLKDKFAFSYTADADLASIELVGEKNISIVPTPIHTLKLIPDVRAELNEYRKKRLQITRELKKMAVFIPYRNRQEHLKIFIPKLRAFLNKQKIKYEIFVIEQNDNYFFNRAALLNIGVKRYGADFDYFCFHDVDFIPIRADYRYCSVPLRLISDFYSDKSKIPKKAAQGVYNHHFASVTIVPKGIFDSINGFSNLYHHYGNEDDDFFMRLLFKGYLPCTDLSGYYCELPHYPSAKILPDSKVAKTFGEKRKLKSRRKKNKVLFSMTKRKLRNPYKEGLNSINYKLVAEKKDKKFHFTSVTLLGESCSI